MVFSGIGRVMAFYNYGKKHFNRKGWLKAERLPVDANLEGRVFVVTGSNSGIGKCLAEHLFSKGARVYMLCRSKDRAESARAEIIKAHETCQQDQLRILIADCAVQAEVERAVSELAAQEQVIDGLVCNAGALLDKKVMTKDNVETTFACHFLYGTYWLGKLSMPLLEKSSDPRLVIITSGGMYTSKLMPFKTLVESPGTFDGQSAYAKAKRCQVVLTDVWAKEFPKVNVIAAHPGWTGTPGVDKVYGSFSQWLLSPLRSLWEGTEGIAWLCMAPGTEIKSGELYLDGIVQPKYLHKSTEHTVKEQDEFVAALREYDQAHSPSPDSSTESAVSPSAVHST